MLADSAFIFYLEEVTAGHQEMSSGVREALVRSDNRSTWALIRLIQCIKGPRLRRLINKSHSVEVRELFEAVQWWVLIGVCLIGHGI